MAENQIYRRIILVDYSDATTEYIHVHTERDLKAREEWLQKDSNVEHYEVIRCEHVSSWCNPDCSPEEDF